MAAAPQTTDSVRLSFHGAAETVTGSKYLLEADGARVLIDCGLFQGLKELRQRNWDPLPFQAASVKCVVLTHAHIDHTGYLPRFVRTGFGGPVFCTPATRDLTELLLLDAAKNQEEDADYANRKGFSKHHPAQPLFDDRDAERAVKLLSPAPMGEWYAAGGPIWFRYHGVGHLLGAAMVEVEVRRPPHPLRILFSGDVGRRDAPLYPDPEPPVSCDYLVCESTYGDRDHPPENVLDQLASVVQGALERGGVMLMAAFAVGRAQQLIYLLDRLMLERRIPRLPVYLDSPMANSATEIYYTRLAHGDVTDEDAAGAVRALGNRDLRLARSVEESKAINAVRGPAVIIASSGMMTGGRILHHLKQRLGHGENTIVLGGFMSEGTRGRLLHDGARFLRIHGVDIPVRAAVVEMSALSGHAGRSELLRWLEPLPAPRRVFLTHGEKPSALSLAEELRRQRHWDVVVPRMGEVVELSLPDTP